MDNNEISGLLKEILQLAASLSSKDLKILKTKIDAEIVLIERRRKLTELLYPNNPKV